MSEIFDRVIKATTGWRVEWRRADKCYRILHGSILFGGCYYRKDKADLRMRELRAEAAIVALQQPTEAMAAEGLAAEQQEADAVVIYFRMIQAALPAKVDGVSQPTSPHLHLALGA